VNPAHQVGGHWKQATQQAVMQHVMGTINININNGGKWQQQQQQQ